MIVGLKIELVCMKAGWRISASRVMMRPRERRAKRAGRKSTSGSTKEANLCRKAV